VLQRPGGFDLGELIQKYLGPAIVGFFVFVLPAIKAAQTAKKQREELKRRGAPAPGEEPAGREAWEDLLKGRGAQAPAVPPPPPRRAEPEPELAEEESLDDNPPPPLVGLPSASATESEEESQAEEYATARERQEAERQVQIAAAEYKASSPYRPDVAPQPASAVPVLALPPAAPRSAAEVWLFPTQPARDRRAALRRAIVLREVLGPPVGLS
jgi:hypothetical protein